MILRDPPSSAKMSPKATATTSAPRSLQREGFSFQMSGWGARSTGKRQYCLLTHEVVLRCNVEGPMCNYHVLPYCDGGS